MEIVANGQALLVQTRAPERITNAIKQSKYIKEVEEGIHQVLVKWTLKTAQTLRSLKIKNVPSPISREYRWPGMFKPFTHQKQTAEFLTLHKKAFCFSEQGTGKTGSAIWAADYLMEKKIIRRVLVIAPLSILQSAWQSELFKLVMHRSVGIAHGQPAKRKDIIRGDYDFVIINYDGVDIVSKEIAEGGFDLIIVDEANAYKSTSTKRWKVLNKLVGPETWCWMMTGTPAAQSPVDAYGLARIINPAETPKYFGTFRDLVMFKVGMFKWIPRPRAEQHVYKLLQPALRHTKEECLDLPEMTYQHREVDMTAQQHKYYNLLKSQMLMAAAGEEITAVNAAVLMNKLLQISAGSVYADSKDTIEFDASNRLRVLREIIEESSNKVLVFANFTHSIDQIAAYLDSEGISQQIIDGRVSGNKRHLIIKRFQETEEPRVLIIQPQAAAHGITLTKANTVVWFSPVTSLENYLQANARVHRAGQINKVTVIHIQGSPVEKRIYKMLEDRVNVHTKIIELYKEI